MIELTYYLGTEYHTVTLTKEAALMAVYAVQMEQGKVIHWTPVAAAA